MDAELVIEHLAEAKSILSLLVCLVSALSLVAIFFLKESYKQLKDCTKGLHAVQKDIAVIKALIGKFGLEQFSLRAHTKGEQEKANGY